MATMYITHNKKVIAIEVSDSEAEESKKKTARLMRKLDQIETAKQQELASRRVCPDCHTKCTPTGFCIRCGRDCNPPKERHVTNRDADFKPITIILKR